MISASKSFLRQFRHLGKFHVKQGYTWRGCELEGAGARWLGPPALVPDEAVVGGAKTRGWQEKGGCQTRLSLTYCPHVYANTLISLIVVSCTQNRDTQSRVNTTVHMVALLARAI